MSSASRLGRSVAGENFLLTSKRGDLFTSRDRRLGYSTSYPKMMTACDNSHRVAKLTCTEFKQDCLDSLSGEMLNVDQTLYTTAPKNPRVKC